MDEFLARADDVLADWEGSEDAASWRADGGHEHEVYPYAYLDASRAPGWGSPVRMSFHVDMSAFEESMAQVLQMWGQTWERAYRALQEAGRVEWLTAPASVLVNTWVDEALGYQPQPDQSTAEAYAARWLDSGPPRVVGSLGPVAGCLSPLMARDVSLRVGWSVSLPPRRGLAPTAGPEQKLGRVA